MLALRRAASSAPCCRMSCWLLLSSWRFASASCSSISLRMAVISATSRACSSSSRRSPPESMAFSNFCCSRKFAIASLCCCLRSGPSRSSPAKRCMLEGPQRGSPSPTRAGRPLRLWWGSLRSNSRRDSKGRFLRLYSWQCTSISRWVLLLSISSMLRYWLCLFSSLSAALLSAASCCRWRSLSAFCASSASRSSPMVLRFASKMRCRRSSSCCRRLATSRPRRSSSVNLGLAVAPRTCESRPRPPRSKSWAVPSLRSSDRSRASGIAASAAAMRPGGPRPWPRAPEGRGRASAGP
mmetsp:Transcript_57997/g.164797  ORF Transcript_57997/g.164797 Transcript_57997/m.164797 type:complete len:296 (+) Transcript_57997:452-1339(+)